MNRKSFDCNFYLTMLKSKSHQFARFFIKDIKNKSYKSQDHRYVYGEIIVSSANEKNIYN